jgi:hypothetical protein
MTSPFSLADTSNPLAQTFRVIEPGGSVLTGVGLFFYSKPASGSIPITLELRPIADGGSPSSRYVYPGTRVTLAPSAVLASTSFNGSSNETKFTFEEPIYIPENTELAFVLHTNAEPGDYQIWQATMGEYFAGSTQKRITAQPATGSFYASSNGTSWTAEQLKDVSFKIYKARFNTTGVFAALYPDVPPPTKLAHLPQLADPLFFTADSAAVKVLHFNHGFLVGDVVSLSGLDSATSYAGVLGSSIIGNRTLTAVDPYGYTFNMDSSADSSVRAGGLNIFATEQYTIDAFRTVIPRQEPPGTLLLSDGDFTTSKSFAGSQQPYVTTSNVLVSLGEIVSFKQPHVLAAATTETNSLSGDPSTEIRIRFNSNNVNVAPSINIADASFETQSVFIDYQDSASTSGRNLITTLPFVSETQPSGGTTAAKYLGKPITLADYATSIRVLIDANRPSLSDFSVWYRVASTDGDTSIYDTNWTQFSKTSTLPNNSNYNDTPTDDNFTVFREYEFNQYDLTDFNQFQIKITMNSRNSAKYPRFQNLRIISTI